MESGPSVALLPAFTKSAAFDFIVPIKTYLEKKKCLIFSDESVADRFHLPKITDSTRIDVFITLGGDGTLCFYKQKYRHFKKVPFTAVNLGGLGFMADVKIEDLESYLDDLIAGKFLVEERLMLEASHRGKHSVAINDVVIHRGSNPSMIALKVHINDSYFNTFLADGIIIASPTGSSAYSLASGGPLMHPTLSAIVITPIAAHTLTNRPFVIADTSKIEIEYISSFEPVFATLDGLHQLPLQSGELISITRSQDTFDLISYPHRQDYFSTLRTKLHWKGSA